MKLHTVGFCGVDDTVDLQQLVKLNEDFAGWIEWGVLLRPDKQGSPRYASQELLPRLGRLARGEDPELPGRLRLAAHLCGDDCLRAINGDIQHIKELQKVLGFRRMQLNPTKANQASGWKAVEAAANLRKLSEAMPELELILQVNEETQELFRLLFKGDVPPPANLVVLLDASCGLGLAPTSWSPPEGVRRFGFAGGLGPSTVLPQLEAMSRACEANYKDAVVWIDMETHIRSKDSGRDIFDLSLVRVVAQKVAESGWLLKSNL
ncbi:unnamed protein product [Durusdinium trenchii]|uniref:Phosphoribosylanthranilate isomerase n=2 Tax=Durusdinium trenchii TaxID=1381693 RepID=A0ABP0PDB4_9DINO